MPHYGPNRIVCCLWMISPSHIFLALLLSKSLSQSAFICLCWPVYRYCIPSVGAYCIFLICSNQWISMIYSLNKSVEACSSEKLISVSRAGVSSPLLSCCVRWSERNHSAGQRSIQKSRAKGRIIFASLLWRAKLLSSTGVHLYNGLPAFH